MPDTEDRSPRIRGWRARRRERSSRETELRAIVVAAVLRNPITDASDPEVVTRMRAGADVSFDELGLDSLARLTIAVELDHKGYAVSEEDIGRARTVDELTRILLDLP
jgi:acyl carrier protein